jgi:hypothetical protein
MAPEVRKLGRTKRIVAGHEAELLGVRLVGHQPIVGHRTTLATSSVADMVKLDFLH